MSLPKLSIRRPVLAWMMMAALIVFGAIGFSRMGISNMPDVNFPVVNISLQLDNAAPEVMESTVVDVIEDAVMGIEGLKSVSSSASQGIANITCEFDLDRDIDVAMQEVQTRIAQAQRQLPTQLYPPVITKTNPEDQPILWVIVSAKDQVPLHQQMMYARNTLKDQLTSISGVGDVILGGYVDTNLRVWLDSRKLRHYQLTANDVTTAIQSEQIEQPAGRIENPSKEVNIRVLGEASTPQQFGQIRINSRSGSPIYNRLTIADVAQIEEGLNDIRALSRFNGKTAVGLGVVKQHGANAVEVAKLLYDKVERLKSTLPEGFEMAIRLDTTRFIHESVMELNFTLLLAALLTSLVCYFFLGSWSSTFNVLLSIPTSIIGTFIALYFFGFTLNTFTLLGLSLAIGIVVDDAIMMLENIVRHHELGKPRLEAALQGAEEITFSAIAATLAIAAIFIPVIFMKGVVGKFFFQYGITVTVAVLLSLLEALTLTPMRCSRFMQSAHHHPNWLLKKVDHFMNRLAAGYRSLLAQALNHRWGVVVASLLFFAGSLALLKQLPQEMIPAQDQSLFVLNLQTPAGTSMTATNKVFQQAEEILKSHTDITDLYTTIGNFNGNDVVNAGTIYVTLVPRSKRKLSQQQIMDRTRQELQHKLPTARVFMQDLSLAGMSASRGYPIEFTLEGPHWEELARLAKSFIKEMESTGTFVDVNTDYHDGMPEIQVVPDRERAADRGVSISSMGSEVSALIGGLKLNANTQYPILGHRYDIRVRSHASEHAHPEDIAAIQLWNNRGSGGGEMVRLLDTARLVEGSAPQIITRMNRMRAIPIYANVAQGHSQQAAIVEVKNLAQKTLPHDRGYRVHMTGSSQGFADAFENLLFALVLGVAVAYMILASQFNSFVHPITVLMALPFSLAGALVALFFTHQSVNLFSMIGLILLMGIVKKNSILLVDFTNQRRSEGLGWREALLEACPVRLRPIVMTSIACIAGAVPAALSFGPGSETRVPMAIAIIGGVAVSTLLTLFVVPCFYSLMVWCERPDPLESDHV